MKITKMIITLVLSIVLGTLFPQREKQPKATKYYTYEEATHNEDGDNGEYNEKRLSFCNSNGWRSHVKFIENPKLASEISYVLLKDLMHKSFFSENGEFNIYSVNNVLWAVYDKSNLRLLLLMQKKDCKILYMCESKKA